MDCKQQMYSRFIFNSSFTRTDLLVSMKSVLEDYIKGTIINSGGQADSFDIFIDEKEKIDKANLENTMALSIVDYVKRNYIVFKRGYEDFAYKDRDMKNYLSKEDLTDILMNTEKNKFLFNLNIFNNCVRVTFR